MKKFLLSTLSVSLLGTINIAHAQSSVTLYGTIDNSIGLLHGNNGQSNNMFSMGSGDLTGPLIGIKGNEQINNDLSAIFQAETGLTTNNGQFNPTGTGRLFNRVAFAGLQSKQYGTLTLGRQWDPSVDFIQPITGDGLFGTHFATPGDVDNNDNTAGINNAVKYTSPSINGLSLEAMYAFSNLAGKNGQGQTWGAGALYNFSNFTVGATYVSMNNPASGMRSTWSSTNDLPSSSDGNFPGPINNGYITAKNISIAQLATQYVVGAFTFGVGYSNAQYRHDGFSAFNANENFNTGRGYVSYQATPALTLAAGYALTKASGDTSATYNQASLASIYALSNRTKVYIIGAYEHAHGTQRVMNGDGTTSLQPAQASLGSSGTFGAANQAYVGVGVSHSF